MVDQQGSLLAAIYSEDRAPALFRFSSGTEGYIRTALGPDLETPLGSLWKLFIYFYLTEEKLAVPSYVCTGGSQEESFCCKPKDNIQINAALYKSCGLFFSPDRLGIEGHKWQEFWKLKLGLSYAWLVSIDQLTPNRNVPVLELLRTLNAMQASKATFDTLNSVLAKVLIEGTAKGAVRKMGSLYRVKTFTWDNQETGEGLIGGFAGWLNNGSPIWAIGQGTSSQVIALWAKQLIALAEQPVSALSRECVVVRFFERYPVREILQLPSKTVPSEGSLIGRFKVLLKNGKEVSFQAIGTVRYQKSASQQIELKGFFDINDYVARVLDREVQTEPLEAARAFGVVIRTYLIQNATVRNGCYVISDSTKSQRVSIDLPSIQAKRIAVWSDRLVLEGVSNIQYHREKDSPYALSWRQATSLADSGYYFDQILHMAYPGGRLGTNDIRMNSDCRRLKSAEAWLKIQSEKWSRRLTGVTGYQPPPSIKVCESNAPASYSDSQRDIIYMRFTDDIEDQVTAAHEYLHLSFKYHPAGMNEHFIENTANELIFSTDGTGETQP